MPSPAIMGLLGCFVLPNSAVQCSVIASIFFRSEV